MIRNRQVNQRNVFAWVVKNHMDPSYAVPKDLPKRKIHKEDYEWDPEDYLDVDLFDRLPSRSQYFVMHQIHCPDSNHKKIWQS